jgi:hypothetical protein
MGRVYWVLERLAAALLGAALIGAIAGAILSVPDYFAGPEKSDYKAWALAQAVLIYIAAIFGLVLGTIPAFVALTLSPAKKHPWKSLPVLILAALAGLCAVFLVDFRTHTGLFENAFAALALFGVPTIAGLLTAWNIDRFRLPFGRARRD